jgi:peptidoglycan/LPS O-acetylase OafA/YrhL
MCIGARKISYREDVQGLRGVSVLGVVIYHCGILFPGGFSGVDIFFVISGFVITNSVLDEIRKDGTFSVRGFFSRRLRRLLPSYLLVSTVTVVLSAVFFDPYIEFPEIRAAAISGLFFSSNLYFAYLNQYDDLVANPLRHLWSLGVEEQFYLTFPFILLAIRRVSRDPAKPFEQRLRRWFLILAVVSLVVNLYVSYLAGPTVVALGRGGLETFATSWGRKLSFYFSPPRYWEILAGCLVAALKVENLRLGHAARTILSMSALLAIASFFIRFGDLTVYPGLAATAPVLGAATIIALGRGTVIAKLLSVSPLKFVGDISYSLYLWHWPLIVILGRVFDNDWFKAAVSVPIAILLATISTLRFESRFRESRTSVSSLLPWLLILPVTVTAISFVQQLDGFQKRYPKTESKSDTFVESINCGSSRPGWETQCAHGDPDSSTSVYVFGDSNARSESDAFASLADTNGWRVTFGVLGACPTNFSARQTSEECSVINEQRLRLLSDSPPSVLVIVNHWTNYLSYPGYGSPEVQVQAFKITLKLIQSLQIPLIVQYQIPQCEYRNQVFNFRFVRGSFRGTTGCEMSSEVSRARDLIGDEVRRLVGGCTESPCVLVDITPAICRDACRPFLDGVNIFSDASHISRSANKLAIPIFQRAADEVLGMSGTGFHRHS